MPLSREQIQAVEHLNGPMMVLAGPGTGKTTVITHRIKHLTDVGVDPKSILVVTFSKAAAVEMKERYEQKLKGPGNSVVFGTFHSIFFQMLKQAYHYNGNSVVSGRLKVRFLEESLWESGYEEVENPKELLEMLEQEISTIKGDGIAPEHYYSATLPADIFQKIYAGYERRMQENHLLDFDDMVIQTYRLFKEQPKVLQYWRSRFRYLLVDEFQDINRMQYEIVKMLAQPDNNLFIVGDDDQSIYGFRGARPEIMLSFPKEYPQTAQVAIHENYRCSREILETAGKVIVQNRRRYRKDLVAKNPKCGPVRFQKVEDTLAQTDLVIEEILAKKKAGVSEGEIAVLARTSKELESFARRMTEFHISFVMRDKVTDLYEHWVVKDVLTYLKIAAGHHDRSLFLQILNRPKRYLSRRALERETIQFSDLYAYYRSKPFILKNLYQMQSDLELIRQLTPYAAMDYIEKKMGYGGFLQEYAKEHQVEADEWVEILGELKEEASAFGTTEEFFLHIEEYQDRLEMEKERHSGYSESSGDLKRSGTFGDSQEKEGVSLMTMHQSKGLEFETVYLPNMIQGIMPYKKAVAEQEIEEERRLLYVAMTRAKKELCLLIPQRRYQKETELSSFLKELLPD